MPNHFHILIAPGFKEYSISDILKSIKQPVARKAINYLKDFNPVILKYLETRLDRPRYRFWQDGGGYDRLLDTSASVQEVTEYIHMNPTVKGLVEKAEDWYWSSANEWINDVPGPIGIDRESYPVL